MDKLPYHGRSNNTHRFENQPTDHRPVKKSKTQNKNSDYTHLSVKNNNQLNLIGRNPNKTESKISSRQLLSDYDDVDSAESEIVVESSHSSPLVSQASESYSSPVVSQASESYSQDDIKINFTRDELLKILNADENSLQPSVNQRMSAEDIDVFQNILDQILKDNTSFTDIDEAAIKVQEGLLSQAQQQPKDSSHYSQITTTGLAGATAYWISFMVGKLATNVVSTASNSPHGAWSFLMAGLLNPLIAEPLANAIRLQGAYYPSPDGKAYLDFYAALQELKLANENNQIDRVNECHSYIQKIVDECVEREKRMDWFKSGVLQITMEDIKAIEDKQSNVYKVIKAAQFRALLSDELPFFWYTALYIITGGVNPLIKQNFSPLTASAIDFGISAVAGSFAGAFTSIGQNYLRKWIQKSHLQNTSFQIKAAQLSLAAAHRDPWSAKMLKLQQSLTVLTKERDALLGGSNQISNASKLDRLNGLIKKFTDELKKVEKKWKKASAIHDQLQSRFKRTLAASDASRRAYMGEVSDQDSPGVLEGIPAQATMIAKLIAIPLSLVPHCIYTGLALPAILSGAQANATALENINITGLNGGGIAQSGYVGQSTDILSAPQIIASVCLGAPLIVGYIFRYQSLLSPIRSWIRPFFGAVEAETDFKKNDRNDTVVHVKKTFTDSEDELENDEDLELSPKTQREIKKLNALTKKDKISNNRNIDGQSREDSDSFESSRSQSSFV